MNSTIDIDAIENAETDYPSLAQMLAGYYHQDWQQDHASPAAALLAFRRDASAETVTAAATEIDRLLAAGFDDAGLAQLLAEGLDCNYLPANDGLTNAAWLGTVRDELRTSA
jgi:CdiI immunity protein